LLLLFIAWLTSRNADNADYFVNGRRSHWLLVAIGMIGSSLSGVTFISIPGVVGAEGHNQAFSYLQVVLGYLLGYMTITLVLMPLYYRLNLISIYGYLGMRFGPNAYKTGSGFFMLSRLIGSAFRMYLAVMVLHGFLGAPLGIPFFVTVITFNGGIRTIVFTDTLQTFCMLAAVILTIVAILQQLDVSIGELPALMGDAGLSKVFFFEGGWSEMRIIFSSSFSAAH
jgi:Na+/proline symporter